MHNVVSHPVSKLAKDPSNCVNLARLLDILISDQMEKGPNENLGPNQVVRGMRLLIKALNETSIDKLDSLVDRIIDSVAKNEQISKEDEHLLSHFRKVLFKQLNLHELILEQPDEVERLGLSHTARKTQEFVELVRVIGQVKDRIDMRQSAYLSHALVESKRLCNLLKRYEISRESSAAVILNTFAAHVESLSNDFILEMKQVSMRGYHEFRKKVRKLTLLTSMLCMSSDTPDALELHCDVVRISKALGNARERAVTDSGQVLGFELEDEIFMCLDEDLRNECLKLFEDVLNTIHNIKTVAGLGFVWSGVDDEKYFSLLSQCFEPGEQERLLQIEAVYNQMKKNHADTMQKDGFIRFFDHARDMSIMLLEVGITDPDAHIVAMCHNTPEDTAPIGNGKIFCEDDIASQYIKLAHSERVADAVLTVGKRPKTDGTDDGEKNLEQKREYMSSLANGSDLALLITMADQLYKLRTLPVEDERFCIEQLKETVDEYIPIFNACLSRMEAKYRNGAQRIQDMILDEVAIIASHFPQKIDELWEP